MNEQVTPQTKPESSGLFPPIALGVGLFVILLFSNPDTIKFVTFWTSIVTLVMGFFTYHDWKNKLSLPFLPLCAFVLLCGNSVFYALAKKFALSEFLGVLLAFCCFSLLLMFVNKIQDIAGAVVIVVACLSFLSIDLLSTRYFYTLLELVMGGFTGQFTALEGVESGVRMKSILLNPNIFAGCAGIGVLLALGLGLYSETKKERRFYLACLMLNSLAFVLAFSMGATATLVIAFFAFLGAEQKEKRLPLFLIMVETLVITIIAAFPIFFTSFTLWEKMNLIPLLATIGAMIALVLVDEKLTQKALTFLQPKQKETKLFVVSVIGVLCIYGILAVSVQSTYTFGNATSLRRAIYPDSGEYTVSGTFSDDITVTIITQNKEDTMMHTSTRLYRGELSQASFVVPEDSMVVYFDFSAESGQSIQSLTLSDGSDVPLNYPLLPGFVANRLQGLFANQNAIQRTVFFEDGMKLFSRSPVFGLGMGSFENALFQVQSFYYETKYVHNHYIQVLLEVGMVGFLAFMAFLGGMMWGLWKARKQENPTPLLATTVAVVLFSFSHATVEVVWSSSFYLILIFAVFSMIALQLEEVCYHPKNPTSKIPTVVAFGLAWGMFTVLLWGNQQATKIVNNSTESTFMPNLVKATKFDLFETQDYMSSYVLSAIDSDSWEVHQQAEAFIAVLETIDSNSIPHFIAQYYVSRGDIPRATVALENFVTYVSSKSEYWNVAFGTLINGMTYENETEVIQSLAHLKGIMEQWNEDNLGTITLSAEIQSILAELSV